MKIAVLAWGSLQWDPRNLEISAAFEPTGPELPIEFSRISGKGEAPRRLTLVIDETNGAPCKTYVALSSYGELGAAKENLRVREGMQHVNGVGFVDRLTGEASFRAMERHPTSVSVVRSWLATTEFDAAIWTALASNFEESQNQPFSIDTALSFLASLSEDNLAVALKYIRYAPQQTQTSLREAVAKRWQGLPSQAKSVT